MSHRRKNSEKSDDEPLNFEGLDDEDDDESKNPFSKQKGRRPKFDEGADQGNEQNEFWTSRVKKNTHATAGADGGKFGGQRFK